MEKLNLPSFEFKIEEFDGKTYIFDKIRKKNIVLTPEEWVRQHFISMLINFYDVPKSLITLEEGIIYHKLNKRSDILVYDRKGNPFILIECKRPTVLINKNVLNQIIIYNKIIKARFLVISNGLKTICFETFEESDKILQLNDLPKFESL